MNPDERISIEEIKKHPYFKDISFVKVFKREYGPIIIKKKDESEINIKLKHQDFKKNIMNNRSKNLYIINQGKSSILSNIINNTNEKNDNKSKNINFEYSEELKSNEEKDNLMKEIYYNHHLMDY